jgi:hypothetical protein
VVAPRDARPVGLPAWDAPKIEAVERAAALRELEKLVQPAAQPRVQPGAELPGPAWAVAEAAWTRAWAAGVPKESGRGGAQRAQAWQEPRWFAMEDG